MPISRRVLLEGAIVGAAAAALPARASPLQPIYDEIPRRHDEALKRIQYWISKPSIAAENIGSEEGPAVMIELLRDAGFQKAERRNTDGKPGVFATLDAGAAKTVGLYFMYDV